jgi:dTDP-4-amino-4,6-dideoxygalactose transaminase
LEAGLGVGEGNFGEHTCPKCKNILVGQELKNNIKQYSGEFKPYLLSPWYRNRGYKEEENTVTTDFTITIMVIALMYQVGCGL